MSFPCRTLQVLEEIATSEGDAGVDRSRAAYCTLARHLPFKRTAAAAIALHEPWRQTGRAHKRPWRTDDALQVAAGLMKHADVKADPGGALTQSPGSGNDRWQAGPEMFESTADMWVVKCSSQESVAGPCEWGADGIDAQTAFLTCHIATLPLNQGVASQDLGATSC